MWLFDRGAGHKHNVRFDCLDMRIEFLQKARPCRSQQINFLETFRQLGRISKGHISGAVDVDIAIELKLFLTTNRLRSPEAVIERVITLKGEGNKQSKLGNHFDSAIRYEQAITATDSFSRWTVLHIHVVPVECWSVRREASLICQSLRDLPTQKEIGACIPCHGSSRAGGGSGKGIQRCRLKEFGLDDKEIAVGHYITALALYKKGLKTGIIGHTEDGRTELRTCLRLLPNNAALRKDIAGLNCRMFEGSSLKTEQQIIE